MYAMYEPLFKHFHCYSYLFVRQFHFLNALLTTLISFEQRPLRTLKNTFRG